MHALRSGILAALVVIATVGVPARALAAANIVVVNLNAAGVGFNDPTPVAPVGGNLGTTLGQQRLNVFNTAAIFWGQLLDSPVPIVIDASMDPLTCTASGAVLGSAGALGVFSDFTGALVPDTWYPSALANRLAGVDLDPATRDISARFNVNLGQPTCLPGSGWYLGLDANHGSDIDLFSVLLHEFAHGLGFDSFASRSTGAWYQGRKDIYSTFLLDISTKQHWPAMTDAERLASMRNARKVVFDGPSVTAAVPTTLDLGEPTLTISAPAFIKGEYLVGTASFGSALGAPLTAEVLQAFDGVPPSTDACEPITTDLTGKIALIDRGTCLFPVKALNAQNAGAVGVIMADNVAGSPPPGAGGFDPNVTIPFVRITQSDGNTIKIGLTGFAVTATLQLDLTRRAGADAAGRALIYTPDPIAPGSSVKHFDSSAFPNLLMEPAINGDLTHAVDLTLPALRDIGWLSYDADGDGVSDVSDPCVNTGGARDLLASLKPRFVLAKINADTVPGNDTLVLTGQFGASAPFVAFDPLSTGARLVLRNQAGGTELDVALPAGAYGGKGTHGWKANSKVTTWTYQDTTASPPGGITRAVIVDQSKKGPNRVKLTVNGKKGSYPVISGDEPLRASFTLGGAAASGAGMCGETAFQPADCSFSKNGKTLTCKQ